MKLWIGTVTTRVLVLSDERPTDADVEGYARDESQHDVEIAPAQSLAHALAESGWTGNCLVHGAHRGEISVKDAARMVWPGAGGEVG